MPGGKLFVIPTTLADGTADVLFTPLWRESIRHVQHFVVEEVRTARRFLSSLKIYPSIEALKFEVLNKSTKPETIATVLQPLLAGHDVGVLSESGMAGVADPGSLAVAFAHQHQCTVRVLPGPSSLVLALAGSGLNGQRFAFNGYLPIDEKECVEAIRQFEKQSKQLQQTQIFIETPFRNNRLLAAMLKTLAPTTRLCVALDITGPEEKFICSPLKQWPKLSLPKAPAVFLFLA